MGVALPHKRLVPKTGRNQTQATTRLSLFSLSGSYTPLTGQISEYFQSQALQSNLHTERQFDYSFTGLNCIDLFAFSF